MQDWYKVCTFASVKRNDYIGDNYIEIHIVGQYKGKELTPANYDISELISTLSIMHKILNSNKNHEPITYELADGSVRHRFGVVKQTALMAASLFALVESDPLLIGLENNTAAAIEELQQISRKHGYVYELYTSESSNKRLTISPTTNFKRQEAVTIDGDFYLYGVLTRAGGSESTTIQINTDKYGTLLVKTNKETLKQLEKNWLYHTCGIYAKGKYYLSTNDIVRDSLELVEILDYSPMYDPLYLQEKIRLATPVWRDVDVDRWLDEVRDRV